MTEYIRSLNANYERMALGEKPEEKRYQYCMISREESRDCSHGRPADILMEMPICIMTLHQDRIKKFLNASAFLHIKGG